jgi:uncharacterized membrane-anchored protein
MIKKSVSLLIIYAIVFLTCSSSLAQTANQFGENQKQRSAKSNLKEFFAKETRQTDPTAVTMADVEKLEKESTKQRMKKNNLSGKQKTWLWIGIAAAAAITVLILVTRNDDDRIITIPNCQTGPC